MSGPAARPRAALVVPVWNQWDYTRRFLESFEAGGGEGCRLLVVDNGSTDETPRRLREWKKRLGFEVLRNRSNRGCAPAWNQGARRVLAWKPAWIGVLNNDLVLTPGWLKALLDRAEERGWWMASPATREGRLDYDLESYARAYTRRCRSWDAPGYFGWCFLVRPEAFKVCGFFDETFRFGKGEDEDFARRLWAKGLPTGITGCSFVHHFGSPTVNALKGRIGEGFERGNLDHLRRRWGRPPKDGPLPKAARALRRLFQRLRWGHLLKE